MKSQTYLMGGAAALFVAGIALAISELVRIHGKDVQL